MAESSSTERWHLAKCSALFSISSGLATRHLLLATSVAKLQRGANAHPVGKLISEGGWPGIARSLCEPVTSTRGIESNKPIVYG